MKEVLIDRSSWHYRIATTFGELSRDLTDRWGDPISSCAYWGKVLVGMFFGFIAFCAVVAGCAIVQDFVMWVWYTNWITSVEPGAGALVVITFGFFIVAGFLVFLLSKLFGVAVEKTEQVETLKSFKDSVIHKLCVPIRLKE